jgi:chromosomal replication initiation ATPase DnaA
LDHIGELLEEQGKQLSEYNLPQPTTYGREVEHELQKWTRLSRELGMRADAAYQTFNQEQRQFFDDVISAVTDNRPLLVFLDGKAGVGKTFLINVVCDKLRSLNIITLPTATSAYAAQLYQGGRTAHSTFKICFFIFMFLYIRSSVVPTHSGQRQ